jgi:hypothetical protein
MPTAWLFLSMPDGPPLGQFFVILYARAGEGAEGVSPSQAIG